MRKTLLSLVVCLAACGAMPVAAQGQADARLPAAAASARAVVTSASGRFIVTAPDGAKAGEYTRWAEGMADRFERFTGLTPTFDRQRPLRIHLADPGTRGDGLLVQCLSGDSGRLYVIRVNESAELDYEELVAGYCQLALTAATDVRRDAAAETLDVPQWLSVGLAQNMDAAFRARNRRLVSGWTPVAQRPGIAEVLGWDHLPGRWHRTRALCGMAVTWLGSLKPQGAVWRAVVDRMATGAPVTAGWVAQEVAGMPSVAAMQTPWQAWMDQQQRVIQDLGAVTSVLVEQLRQTVLVPADELKGIARERLPAVLEPRALLGFRKEPVVRFAAEVRAQQVQALTIGKAPELVEAGGRYARFFEALGGGASSVRLRWRLRSAERELARLASLTTAREAYVDAIEREVTSSLYPAKIPGPVLEKSRIEAYVDEAEGRFGRTDNEAAGGARREGVNVDEQGKAADTQDNGRPD